jgi:hypothetical protein
MLLCPNAGAACILMRCSDIATVSSVAFANNPWCGSLTEFWADRAVLG